jgi:uncharacterized membrane protein
LKAAQQISMRSFQWKHLMFVVLGLLMILVWFTRDKMLLDPGSFLRQRYAPIPWLMIFHGVPGAIALFLAPFQFSNRLRQRYLQVHRIMGRIYVGCVLISAPVAVKVSTILVIPTLFMASVIQSSAWIITTVTALYCIRTRRVQQHREWMMRSYPFAMVFIVGRAIIAIPAVARTGELGIATVVWSVIATACFLPSFLIAWKGLLQSKPALRSSAAAQD